MALVNAEPWSGFTQICCQDERRALNTTVRTIQCAGCLAAPWGEGVFLHLQHKEMLGGRNEYSVCTATQRGLCQGR